MYIATIPNRYSKPAILLRESYREGKSVKTKTLANLSTYHPERIDALRRALKGEFDNTVITKEKPSIGQTFGTYFALKSLADEIGLTKILGNSHEAKLALFLTLTRVAHQGSRLSAIRFAKQHAISDILAIKEFDENDLYGCLDYLCKNQETIEKKLYTKYLEQNEVPPTLVLYDVTSSYFEGDQNELAAYGYNRDGKKGKKQIVIGLLADKDGEPLAVRVFKGNTSDTTTVIDQINLLKNNFKIKEVVFVGDRGMVKTKAQEALGAESFHYITALTYAQTHSLINQGIIQPDFFDTLLYEAESNQRRHILMRNDIIKAKKVKTFNDKIIKLNNKIDKRNQKVGTSLRAKPEKGQEVLQRWLNKNKLDGCITLSLDCRMISYQIDEHKKEKLLLLAGCYVLITDVAKETMSAAEVYSSYKGLQKVERNFRNMKTELLEVRPIYVRKKDRTIGHVFVSMLALKIVRLLEKKLKSLKEPITVNDALNALARFVFLEYQIGEQKLCRFALPDFMQSEVFLALGVDLNKIAGEGCRQKRKRR